MERAILRQLAFPYGLGVCCSAGVSAGMASLAACSTGGAFGWKRGRWVEGTQAGSKAGRRLESLPHKSGVSHEGGGRWRWSAQSCVPRRQSWRRMAWERP